MLKKLGIVLLVTLCMLPVSAMTVKVGSDVIENDETGIPDKALYRGILQNLKKKKDEKFTRKEAEDIKTLRLGCGNKIMTFKGLGYLKNMDKLECGGICTGDLEEIAAEAPWLKRLFVGGYDEESDSSYIPPVEERKPEIDSLEPLRNMKNLIDLNVSDNKLTSLDGIEGLKRLKVLRADKNQITNADGLKGTEKLAALYISDNRLTDLNSMKRLKNLTYLDASNNNLTSVDGIGSLKKLEKLYLSGNQLSGVKGIKNLKKLEELYLNDNSIEEIGEIGQLKNLVILNMNNNKLTGTKGIKKLKNLAVLRMNGNRLKKLGEISQLKNLESLSLNANRISILTDSDMKKLKKLTWLHMFDNELKKLPSKKSLKKLSLAEFHWNYLTKKEIKKKLTKMQCEGFVYKWMWDEQKTGIQITYLSPDKKTGITKDTKEIVGMITPKTFNDKSPDFYLLLPDGKMEVWDGKSYNAADTDENGIFRIEGIDLRAYAGKEVRLVALFDYEFSVILDRFTVQE